MKQYYECHITLLGNKKIIEENVKVTKWRFSSIDGDPVLGDGVKCYATMFFKSSLTEKFVLNKLHKTADFLQHIIGLNVIRRKIEKVIYDDKSSQVNFNCNGSCVGCHLDDYGENK